MATTGVDMNKRFRQCSITEEALKNENQMKANFQFNVFCHWMSVVVFSYLGFFVTVIFYCSLTKEWIPFIICHF